jgi:hypothetical protein
VFSVKPLAQMNWALNIISEVFSKTSAGLTGVDSRLTSAVFILPLPLIRGLHFHFRREKAGLLCVFLLGLFTISASIARFSVQDLVTNSVPLCTSPPGMQERTTLISQ